MKALLAILVLLFAAVPAFAVNPDEVLDDPALESRARDISGHLRCLVCQNQSIDDSDAELARDLRLIVRERLVAGDSDDEAIDFIVARYGEFVLLNPVVAPHTILLWVAAPLVLLAGAGTIAIMAMRRRRSGGGDLSDVPALSEAEAAALAALEGGPRPESRPPARKRRRR